MPYSGPASAYGVIGKTEAAYFRMINDKGGINGRKINFVTYDDAYSPPKAVEQARKLVESDEVLVVFNPLGTPSNIRDPEIPELQEGAATVRRLRRDQVERSQELPVDHGLAAQLPERGAHLRQVSDEGETGRQDRRALPERRLRQGLPEGAEGWARRQGVDDRQPRKATRHRNRRSRTTSSSSRPPASTSSSASRRRNSRRRRSRRSPSSSWKPLHIVSNVSASVGGVIKPAGFENAQGHPLGRLCQGRRRSAVGQRSRHEEVLRLPRQILSRRQQDRQLRWSTATARRRRW